MKEHIEKLETRVKQHQKALDELSSFAGLWLWYPYQHGFTTTRDVAVLNILLDTADAQHKALARTHQDLLSYAQLIIDSARNENLNQQGGLESNTCSTILQRLDYQLEHVGIPAPRRPGWQQALLACQKSGYLTETQYEEAVGRLDAGGK